MESPIILFRKDRLTEDEFSIAAKNLPITQSRVNLNKKLVIGRYSVLPYYHELENDLFEQHSSLINSYQQHLYIANFDYYNDIQDLTPKTYFDLQDIPDKGSFVVKGKTNSKKHQWDKLMFASDRRRAIEIACDLKLDSMIQNQDIIVREYVQLKTLDVGLNGLCFTNEWRFFIMYGEILAHGFYWSEMTEAKGSINIADMNIINEVIKRVSNKVNFYVVDIAQKEDGNWIVIELNDGQMSGLSDVNPEILYTNMKNVLEKK